MTLFAVLSGFFEGGFHGQRATVLSEMVRPALLDLSVGYMIFAQGIGNTLGPVGGGKDMPMAFDDDFSYKM